MLQSVKAKFTDLLLSKQFNDAREQSIAWNSCCTCTLWICQLSKKTLYICFTQQLQVWRDLLDWVGWAVLRQQMCLCFLK